MRFHILHIALLLPLIACQRENTLEVNLRKEALTAWENMSGDQQFYGTQDTIQLNDIPIFGPTYVEIPAETNAGSSLGNVSQLRVEKREKSFLNLSRPLEIKMELAAQYVPQLPAGSASQLGIQLLTSSNTAGASLDLEYRNSWNCLSPNCAFADSLMIDSTQYLRVHYLTDSTVPQLYWSEEAGVVGFRGSDQILYKK